MSPGSASTLEEVQALTEKHLVATYRRLPAAFVRGEGAYLWDTQGNKYLDFVTGIGVCGLGHCHAKVVSALQQQAAILMHTSNLYHIDLQARLGAALSRISGGKQAFFCNSGAEANEAAIKLARKHAIKGHGVASPRIICAQEAFHGRTLAALSATGQEKYRQGFDPLPAGFAHVPFNDVGALQDAMGKDVAAIFLEPVQGESGVWPAQTEYLAAARRLCDESGALLILDEVQTGIGRTGRMFAYEHYGVVPDVLTLAKTLGNGMPIGAMLAEPEVARALRPGDHASTFGGNFLACAAALAVIQAIEEEGLVQHADEMGKMLGAGLDALRANFPFVTDVRGLGLMRAIGLEKPAAPLVQEACFKQGLIVNAIGEHTVRLLPPLVVTPEQIATACDTLSGVLSGLA